MRKVSKSARNFTFLICMLLVFLNLPVDSTSAAGEAVNVWVTTTDQSKLLQRQADIAFAPDSGSNPVTIDVNEATTYQQIDGFGASLTDSSASLICGPSSLRRSETRCSTTCSTRIRVSG